MFAAWRRLALLITIAMIPVMTARPAAAQEPRAVQIGVPKSLFRDAPKGAVEAMTPVFTHLMETQIGTRGKIVILGGSNEVSQQLSENKVQLAVFHGFEFAWAQSKDPTLRPLVVAIKASDKLTAQVIVAADSKIEKLEDLKGETVAIPKGTPEHARLFLSRRTQRIGHRQEKFFGALPTPQHVTAALEDVISGKVKATVVDGVAWESFQWANPARAAKLKSLMQSEPFPAGVIAYKQGTLTDA